MRNVFPAISPNVIRLCEGLMALHFRPKPVLLLGFVIGSKFIPQPAFCKTACYMLFFVLRSIFNFKN